jgi:SlyX protein
MNEPDPRGGATLAARIDALEIRVAYQDQIIDDLNAAVTDQWKHIDALTRRIEMLVDRVQEAETRASSSGAPEPPPPHY